MIEAADLIASNRTLGSRFFIEQDRLRGGPAEELCAPEYTATIGGNPVMDRAGHEAFALGFYAGFPDAMHDVEEVFATADRVAVRFVIHGSHTGSFFGIPATGRPIKAAAHVILDVSGGRVTRLRALFDEAGLLRQLGVLP
jgi:predicted ester cyclase